MEDFLFFKPSSFNSTKIPEPKPVLERTPIQLYTESLYRDFLHEETRGASLPFLEMVFDAGISRSQVLKPSKQPLAMKP